MIFPFRRYPSFLGSETGITKPEDSRFHVIPVPCEKTVSYGGGTANGPRAILSASWQLELFDGESVPAVAGIFTRRPVPCTGRYERILDRIESAADDVLSLGKIPVVLGGEHTVTLGAVRAMKKRGMDIGVIQFDAHADLRPSFEGSAFSHACVMRRIVELGIPVIQIGVRSLSPAETEFRREMSIIHYDASYVAHHGLPADFIPESFPANVYVTIDIDCLDPSIVPATGTPEPGGLGWYDLMDALRTIAAQRSISAFDLVELAPVPGLHASDFTAARLVYNMMGIINRSLPL